MPAPSHAAAKLVQLGKAESFGVFDNHQRGVWHVNSHFDDGGGHQDVDFSRKKISHDPLAFFLFHFSVQKAYGQIGEQLVLQVLLHFDRGLKV